MRDHKGPDMAEYDQERRLHMFRFRSAVTALSFSMCNSAYDVKVTIWWKRKKSKQIFIHHCKNFHSCKILSAQ